MRMSLDGFERSFRIDGHLVTKLRHADDILLITIYYNREGITRTSKTIIKMEPQ